MVFIECHKTKPNAITYQLDHSANLNTKIKTKVIVLLSNYVGHSFKNHSYDSLSNLQCINLHCMYQTCWIGLSDSAVEGSYRWESDNSLVNYTHWGTEEPNDFAGVEDCVAVWGGASAGYWNDDYCDSEKYFICEKPGGMFHCFSSMVFGSGKEFNMSS